MLNDMKNETEEIDSNARTFYEEHVRLLNNSSQQAISDGLTQHIDNADGNFFFIGAFGGVGKSFLMNV